MANKSTLITQVTTELSVPITKAEHVAAETKVIDNLYPSVIICNNLPTGGTNGILTPMGSSISTWRYNLRFRKIGNCVFVEGTIQNLTSQFFSSAVGIATINDTEFRPDRAVDGVTNIGTVVGSGGINTFRGLSINIIADNGIVAVATTNAASIAPTETIFVKGHYFTQP